MGNKTALIIFVRKAELGKVKTRLAKSVGDEHALVIYKKMLQHTANVAMHSKFKSYIFYTDQVVEDDIFSNKGFEKSVQIEGDLGAKMKHAFQTVLKENDKALIIGSDCLQVSPNLLKQADTILSKNQVVIGPAFDGGYYLLGMHNTHHELFDGIPWSSSEVFSKTIQQIELLNLSFEKLPVFSDVDYEQDWLEQMHLIDREEPIHHVVRIEDWNAQKDLETYSAESLSIEGFIHCCYEDQFDHVLSSYFKKGAQLLILRIDTKAVGDKLFVENAGIKGDFPHIYGPIDKSWIVEKKLLVNG